MWIFPWSWAAANKQLKGGSVSTIMGGCELDFRNADMEKEEMVLEISSIMGGVDILVPSHWQVVMHGTPILGSVEDKTTKPENPTKKLIIKGSAIMGGVEIKN
jgi:predicted membrane protein